MYTKDGWCRNIHRPGIFRPTGIKQYCSELYWLTKWDSGETVPLVHGIYLDDLSSGITVTGNTAAGNSYSGLYLHSTKNCKIQNNTMYDNDQYQNLFTSYDATFPTVNTTLTNNIFFSKTALQKWLGCNRICTLRTIDGRLCAFRS